MKNFYNIIAVNGHYEVYNADNEFIFSGDTYAECEHDINEYFDRETAA